MAAKNESELMETMEEEDNVEESIGVDSDSEGSSDSSESEEDEVSLQKIAELEGTISGNPFLYDPYIELIKLLRKAGELDKLRTTRQKMSEIFPLTERLWLDWLEDEIQIVSSSEERENVTRLFQRATNDYMAVGVWLEYVQFAIGGMAETNGIQKVRNAFEKALTAVGLHVTKGSVIWEAYREFENAILAGLQPLPGSVVSKEQQEQIDAQTNKILALFRRQLSLPLIGLDDTWNEYVEWTTDGVDQAIEQTYQKSQQRLADLLPFEKALTSAKTPRFAEYVAYIDHEISQGDPARIQCLFERATEENCLNPAMWIKYTKYLDDALGIKTIIISVYERAVRNCPWSVVLWLGYVRALERHLAGHEKIKEMFDRAMNSGFTQGSEFLQIWTAYCDYLRRRVNWEEDHAKELEELRDTFDRAIAYLQLHYPEDGDPNCYLLQYWARIEAKFCRNMEKARELWNLVLQSGFSNQATAWLDFYNMERCYGDHKHCRKVLQRAVNSVNDWPESVCEAYITYEREEGTLEQYDQAVTRCAAQMKRVEERREKAAGKEAALTDQKKKQRNVKKAEKKTEKKAQPPPKPIQWQKETPPQQNRPVRSAGAEARTSAASSEKAPVVFVRGQKKPLDAPPADPADDSSTQGTPKRKLEDNTAASLDKDGFKVPHSPGFKPPPSEKKASVAPPPGYKGPPKASVAPPPGYKGAAPDPLEPPSKKIKGDDAAADPTPQESTSTPGALDASKQNRTAFVSNLEFSIDETRIKEIFSKSGAVTEVRLVRNFRGKSKGYAYVEFKDELMAMKAMRMDREPVDGRPMYVSPCEDKSSRSNAGFKFSTDLEKNKLFVKGLPFSTGEDALHVMFGQHGKIKSIRLVTYRSGASKGLAYIEYENESDATQAVMKTDGLQLGEHTISVSISNPPTRKQPTNQREAEAFTPTLGSGKRETADRGKARTQLSLLPRSLHKKPTSSGDAANGNASGTDPKQSGATSAAESATESASAKAKKSNADFRNLLYKK